MRCGTSIERNGPFICRESEANVCVIACVNYNCATELHNIASDNVCDLKQVIQDKLWEFEQARQRAESRLRIRIFHYYNIHYSEFLQDIK